MPEPNETCCLCKFDLGDNPECPKHFGPSPTPAAQPQPKPKRLQEIVEMRERFKTGISCDEIGRNATLWMHLMNCYIEYFEATPACEEKP